MDEASCKIYSGAQTVSQTAGRPTGHAKGSSNVDTPVGTEPSLFLLFCSLLMGFYSRKKLGPCRYVQFDLNQWSLFLNASLNLFFNASATSIRKDLTGDNCCFYVKGVDF